MSDDHLSVILNEGSPDETIRILIADDQPQLRDALTELLSHDPRLVVVGAVADAETATEVAATEHPDIAIVDVTMADGGGPKAAREMSRRSPSTRVVALSGVDDRDTLLEMLHAGAVGYLIKGSADEEVLGAIFRLAHGDSDPASRALGGIVGHLGSRLRRGEIEREERERARDQIDRFLRGEGFTAVYQPIVDLTDGAVAGFEALTRFHTLPVRPPHEWFSDAHSLGMGVELELAVIHGALLGLEIMPHNAYLSINASSRAAMSPALQRMIEPVAGRVVIEITEHEEVDDYELLLRELTALRELGTRVAIDDAGAGFASWRHTLQINPNIIKADMTIVRGVDGDRAKRALTSSMVAFAREMGMTIVAEGIETKAEMETLVEIGVRYGQGFFIGEPSPLSEHRL